MSYNSPDDTINGCSNSTVLSVIENNEPERLRLYRSVVQETLKEIFSVVNFEEFSNEFQQHPIAKTQPQSINTLYTMMTENLHKKVSDIIEKQIKEDKLEEKFNQLDEIISNSSSSSTPTWRLSRDVESNFNSLIMKQKILLRDQMKHIVTKKEDSVNKMKFNVSNARIEEKVITQQLENCESKLVSMINEMK